MKIAHSFRYCAALMAVLMSDNVLAQGTVDTYPVKPVTVVAPFPPGGAADQEARLYTNKMSAIMGKQFVVEYKPGAANTIGVSYVSRSAPDGYTLLVTAVTFVVSGALKKNLPYDILKDFAPVSLMSKRPILLMTNPVFPAKTMVEYFAYAKANPGKINYATTGSGSVSHLVGAWLHSTGNTKVTFIHYKGAAPATADLVAGRVDVYAVPLLAALGLIKSGKLRALANLDNTRSGLLPTLATVAEQGTPEFGYANWIGFIAPGATPITILNKLGDGFAKVAKAPDVAGPLKAQGSELVGSTPAQFKQIILAETARWRKVVKDNGIQLEN